MGKCLYESAMGNVQLVKARFTRSFLAQLIGLRINYKVSVYLCVYMSRFLKWTWQRRKEEPRFILPLFSMPLAILWSSIQCRRVLATAQHFLQSTIPFLLGVFL